VTLTDGDSATVAVTDFVVSAALVAVTVTVFKPETVAGAVYNPVAEMLPRAGLSNQVTAEFPEPVTVAVNCWVWPAVILADVGLTVTPTEGAKVTTALAVLLASAALAAVTVTELVPEIVDGAVYRPLEEIVPTAGLNDQVTLVLVLQETMAENCWA
jgi:hypothetical protein